MAWQSAVRPPTDAHADATPRMGAGAVAAWAFLVALEHLRKLHGDDGLAGARVLRVLWPKLRRNLAHEDGVSALAPVLECWDGG